MASMKPVSSSFSLASMHDDDKSHTVVPRSPLLDKSAINILLLENIHGRAVQMLRDEGYNVETHSKISPEELLVKIRKAHAIGVRSKTCLSEDVLDEAENLMCVGCFCIGTDQTDLLHAASMGVPVFNSPYANTRSVAELVIGEMIALARQFVDRSNECHKGQWKKDSKGCYEIRGKTLGIIGYGRVGSQLSVLAESLGAKVIFYDNVPVLPMGNAKAVRSMDEVLSHSDFVSLHVPLTMATSWMVGAREVALMKRGSYLINASRGEVVKVAEVADALKSGHLAGAAFDVFPHEPATGESFESELRGLPNVILTPHVGGSTEEAQASIGVDVAAKLISYINNGKTIGAVNFPEIDLPPAPGSLRLLNVHRNVPGVLRGINTVLADYNVSAQVLGTKGKIGYLIAQIDTDSYEEAKSKMLDLPNSIRIRIL